MKKLIVLVCFLGMLVAPLTAIADDLCDKEWPDSLQMKEYCNNRQVKYIYLVSTTFTLLKNDPNSIDQMEYCISMHNIDGITDWQLIYLCMIAEN